MALCSKGLDKCLEDTTGVSAASRRDAEGTALEQDEDRRKEIRKKESTKVKAEAGKKQLRIQVGIPLPNGLPGKCSLYAPTKPH